MNLKRIVGVVFETAPAPAPVRSGSVAKPHHEPPEHAILAQALQDANNGHAPNLKTKDGRKVLSAISRCAASAAPASRCLADLARRALGLNACSADPIHEPPAATGKTS